MNLRYLLLITLFMTLAVEARMYQWVDEDTGTTQFSGKPPTWYRSDEVGPRTFVFDGGRIVDDTGIQVSEEHRSVLRRRAYDLVELDEERQRQVREEAISSLKSKKLAAEEEEQKTKAEEAEAAEEKLAAAQEAFEKEEELADANEELAELLNDIQDKEFTELSVDEMQQLVQEWEALQERAAREIIAQ